jgi:hypothetical protein
MILDEFLSISNFLQVLDPKRKQQTKNGQFLMKEYFLVI